MRSIHTSFWIGALLFPRLEKCQVCAEGRPRLLKRPRPSRPGASPSSASNSFQELYYNQTLDHFNPQDGRRWSQRYLFSDEFWTGAGGLSNGCRGPILLYTGNEGDIEGFWEGNGFMIDYLAPKWGAMLVFPEERYYGKSLPFGNSSLEAANLRWLSTEQVTFFGDTHKKRQGTKTNPQGSGKLGHTMSISKAPFLLVLTNLPSQAKRAFLANGPPRLARIAAT